MKIILHTSQRTDAMTFCLLADEIVFAFLLSIVLIILSFQNVNITLLLRNINNSSIRTFSRYYFCSIMIKHNTHYMHRFLMLNI